LIVLAFAAIYLIWGSTYLAIRIGLETLPPFFMMGIRSLSAGGLLMAWAGLRGADRPSVAQWRSAIVLGVLFFVVGHGALAWGAERVPSGVAALSMATVPVWTTLLQSLVQRIEIPAWRLIIGLILGFGGVAILADPAELLGVSTIDAQGMMALQVGALSWSVGSVYSKKPDLPPSATLVAAMSLTTGGVLLLVLSGAHGEEVDLHAVTARSAASLTYLVLCGSIVTFGAYTWLLEKTSPVSVSTCAFVNPVIAVVLGYVVGGEPFDSRILNASLLMVIGVGAIVMRWPRGGRDEAPLVHRRPTIEVKEVP
jgi:drug/metabolite transporter (DMT)-like permease